MKEIKRQALNWAAFAIAFAVVFPVSHWVDALFTGRWYIDAPLWLAVLALGGLSGYYSRALVEVIAKRMTRDEEES